MNAATHLDANIPILTEVISVEDESLVVAEEPIGVQHAEPVNQAPLSEQTLEQLEKTLRESVLRQLLTRVDFVLEHRVRDGLADVLQTAVDGLAKDIREGLAKSLEEVIQRTVSQEISKIQSLNSKP